MFSDKLKDKKVKVSVSLSEPHNGATVPTTYEGLCTGITSLGGEGFMLLDNDKTLINLKYIQTIEVIK